MEPLMAITALVCLSCLLGIGGVGAIFLLIKLGVIANYWRRPDPTIIDGEYSLEQQREIEILPHSDPMNEPVGDPSLYTTASPAPSEGAKHE